MVYDPVRQRVIVFGGVAKDQATGNEYTANDTWEWDGKCWKQIPTVQSPPPSRTISMVYDPKRDSTILYRGDDSVGAYGDTWELLGNSWIQVPTKGPGPGEPRMAYDSARDVVVLGLGTELWEWSIPRSPALMQEPINTVRFVGEPASLSACGTGQGAVFYQWFFNGTNAVPNASSPTLHFDSVQAAQAGAYSVRVSNSFGSVTSVVATLTVTPCQTTPSGLISWWRAEGNALDSSSTNNAVLANGLGFANGEVMQAFTFNGIDQHLKVNASTNLNLRTAQGITVEGWINPNDLAPRPLVEWNRGGNDNASLGVHFWTSAPDGSAAAGVLFASVRDTSHIDHILASDPGVLTSNSFQHLAFTYNRPSGIAGRVFPTRSTGQSRLRARQHSRRH